MKKEDFYIETERLTIRPYELGDAPLLKNAIDESLEHLSTFMLWTKHEPQPVIAKEEKIKQWQANFEKGDYTLGVFAKDDERFVASTGFHHRSSEGIKEIGYWVHVDEINKGFATEFSAALTTFAFEKLNMEKVEIRCDIRNKASARIPQKLGYALEYTYRTLKVLENGERNKDMVWTMFREEWKK